VSAPPASAYIDPAALPEERAAIEGLASAGSAKIFAIDIAAPAAGLAELIAARRAGETTAVYPIIVDPFEHLLYSVYATIDASPSREAYMTNLNALRSGGLKVNGRDPADLVAVPEPEKHALMLALRLADVLLLGAPAERDRYVGLTTALFDRFALLPVAAAPAATALDPAAVTLYAPSVPHEAVAPLAKQLALAGIVPKIISSANAGEPITSRTVLLPEWRAMRARALAAAGHHVATPNVRRVDECDSRIFGYDPADYRAMLRAVDAALASPGGKQRFFVDAAAVRSAIGAERVQSLEGPRISVIVRTFDRPALLARAVRSIALQSYRNVEIVVVNNGGDDVRNVVESAAAGRPLRYEVMPERRFISAASNEGARAASGAYIGYLDDDDLLYADHCARTVDVLERTSKDIAFTLCVGEYARMSAEEKHVLGYQIYLDRTFSLDDLLVNNISPIHSMVHRRELFDRFGFFDEDLPVTDDWEFWLRAAAGGATFIRIDRATCEYSWRFDPDRGNMTIQHQNDFVVSYEKIRARYAHLWANRTRVIERQEETLDAQRDRARQAADPALRASLVISSMNKEMVAVAPISEERFLP
jgi:hypothetical protein